MKSSQRVFRALENSDRRKFLALLALRIVAQSLDLLGLAAVGLLGAIVAANFSGGTASMFFGYKVPTATESSIFSVLLAIVGFFILKSAFSSLLLRVTTKFLAGVESRASAQISRSIFLRGLQRLRDFPRAEQQWIIAESSHFAFSNLLFSLSALVTEGALFILIFGLFLVVDFSSALLVAIYFALLVVVFHFSVNKRLLRLGERLGRSLVGLNQAILDLNSVYREASVAEKLAVFVRRIDGARAQYARDIMLHRFVMGLPRFFIETGLMLGVLALTLWQLSRGSLSEGLVTAGIFLAGGVRLMAALLPFQNALTEIRTYSPQAEAALALMEELRSGAARAVKSDQGPKITPPESADAGLAVEMENVSFSYQGSNSPALKNISLKIEPGSLVAIVGPSGAGKSTLGELALGLYEPETGSVRIDGELPKVLRNKNPGSVAYVPQKPGLVSGSIAENIALGGGSSDINYERVEESLRRAQLWNLISSMPHGLHSSVGKNVDALSGGEIQRLGIARALYSNPKMIVLDEATSNLDAKTEAAITDLLLKLKTDSTIVVIAHRLSTVKNADKVIFLDNGKIVDSGTFDEVKRRVPLFSEHAQLMDSNR